MIDYTYNTTGARFATYEDESRIALHTAEVTDQSINAISLQISDSGKHHAGICVMMRVWMEDNAEWLRLASAYLTEKQARELVTAITQALAMREYDDGF